MSEISVFVEHDDPRARERVGSRALAQSPRLGTEPMRRVRDAAPANDPDDTIIVLATQTEADRRLGGSLWVGGIGIDGPGNPTMFGRISSAQRARRRERGSRQSDGGAPVGTRAEAGHSDGRQGSSGER
jgi:hypothetical protein